MQRATAAGQLWDEPLKEPLDELRDEPLPRTRKQRLILAKQALDAGGFELPRVASRTRIASLPALPLLEPVAGAACRGRHRVRGASRGEHRSTALQCLELLPCKSCSSPTASASALLPRLLPKQIATPMQSAGAAFVQTHPMPAGAAQQCASQRGIFGSNPQFPPLILGS